MDPPFVSTDAYTVAGALRAYASSTRTNDPPGSPVAAVHVAPPSVDL